MSRSRTPNKSPEPTAVGADQQNLKLLDPPHTEPPSEDDIKLMQQLIDPYAKPMASGLARRLGLSLAILDYKADLLRSSGYITVHHNIGGGELSYSLSKKGRKFLFEKGLLT